MLWGSAGPIRNPTLDGGGNEAPSGQMFLAQRDFEAALDAFDTAAETFIDAIAADPYEDTPRLAFAWFHSDRTTSGRRF